jgi:dihydrofolate reductase
VASVLTFSMSVSVDGFITDRHGRLDWSVPDDELFAFHHARVSELGAIVMGRRLYETMLVWETDPSFREDAAGAAFADAWSALPKVVFSRTLTQVQGNARLAQGSLTEEIAAVLDSTDRDVEIGGADLAGQAMALGAVDEFSLFRHPVILGAGRPALPVLDETSAPITLDLVDTCTFGSRVIYERYRRILAG